MIRCDTPKLSDGGQSLACPTGEYSGSWEGSKVTVIVAGSAYTCTSEQPNTEEKQPTVCTVRVSSDGLTTVRAAGAAAPAFL